MHDRRNAIKARVDAADAFAASVKPIIAEMRKDGATLQEIADLLSVNKIMTARNCTWTPNAVRKILERDVPVHAFRPAQIEFEGAGCRRVLVVHEE